MSDQPPHVSLVALPEAMLSTLIGLYDVLSSLEALASFGEGLSSAPPFRVEIVGVAAGPLPVAGGLPATVQRALAELPSSDIVIVPSLLIAGDWQPGRYPELVAWLAAQHRGGALLCSACSGVFLLAETGLFDGRDCTIHWGYREKFARTFPKVRLHPEQVLVIGGRRGELVSSGASTSWHDLALYLIAQHAGVPVAQAATKFFAMQWHQEGLAPYVVFEPPRHHGDAAVTRAQAWLAENYPQPSPVEELVRRSGLSERSFKRRFRAATGLTPIDYVQRLRIEEAKRRLERTRVPVEEISWQVGYEDAAFFRRLFKRLTSLSPGAYRRRFQGPAAMVGS
ncbi:MAG: helix-turn-helix domain-containing protein [Tistlia sp.]|uniref:GlxA family transcriptional regulator n=1 Tax=Tistlia sp. TaxID=3057121 RepID=UPI0034A57752